MYFTLNISNLAARSLVWAAMAFSVNAAAAPSIQWNPEKIEIRQMQGTQTHYSAEVIFNAEGQNVTARLVPALEQWITVSPVTYGDIQQGQSVTVDLVIDIPSNEALGNHSGVLQLRSGKNQKNLAKPLQISLTIIPQTNGGLPPDPGEAGKATLLGIDSDLDGVRDDIQRYIALTYPNRVNLQNALLQLSRTYQAILDVENAKGKEAEIAKQVGEDIACFYYVAGRDLPRYDILNDIEAEILNTSSRTRAYLQYDRKLAGKVFPGTRLPRDERYKHCNFDQ